MHKHIPHFIFAFWALVIFVSSDVYNVAVSEFVRVNYGINPVITATVVATFVYFIVYKLIRCG